MFKLIKIEGSGSNQAEPIRIKSGPGISYKYGCAYVLCDGFLTNAEPNVLPTHIALENLGYDEKETVLCYRIQDNMIFEVPIKGNFESLSVGFKYTLDIDDEGAALGITSTTSGGVMMIHDINGAKKSGDTVYVRATREASY